jgi:hypothetical protein
MLDRLATAISSTSVSAEHARAAQSTGLSGCPGGGCPETTAKDWDRVPAFEADYVMPGPRVGNERRADLFLAELVLAWGLARVDQ